MSYYNNALIKAEAIAKATDYLTDEEAENQGGSSYYVYAPTLVIVQTA